MSLLALMRLMSSPCWRWATHLDLIQTQNYLHYPSSSTKIPLGFRSAEGFGPSYFRPFSSLTLLDCLSLALAPSSNQYGGHLSLTKLDTPCGGGESAVYNSQLIKALALLTVRTLSDVVNGKHFLPFSWYSCQLFRFWRQKDKRNISRLS